MKALVVFVFLLCLMALSCVVPFGKSETGWARVYVASTTEDYPVAVVQTSDGGYAIAGSAEEEGEDVNALLIKTDSSGNMQWNQSYGGRYHDDARAIVQTSDGGYALAGKTCYTRFCGTSDFWLVKTDASGNMQWNQTYDGMYDDFSDSMIQTSDGGYALVGSAHVSDYAIWLVKTDSSGNAQWNRTFGEPGDDFAYSVIQTSDGGYAIGGRVGSQTGQNGSSWLAKTDSLGNLVWDQKYGGYGVNSVVQADDGGYAITGSLGKQLGQNSSATFAKTDSSGNLVWCKTGGASHLIKTMDGGYAFLFASLVKTDSSGNTQWYNDFGYITDDGYGGSYFTNDFGDLITDPWNQIQTKYLIQTSDGGYAVAGFAPNGPGIFLVKTDETGVVPEFPSLLAIPLLATLAVFVKFARGKIEKKDVPASA